MFLPHLLKPIIAISLLITSNPIQAQQCTISNRWDKNIVYLGLDNELSISVENNPCSSILVSTDIGDIKSTGDCWYNYTSATLGKATITVFIKKGNKKKKIKEFYLWVERFAPPIIYVEQIKEDNPLDSITPYQPPIKSDGGNITRDSLLLQKGLRADLIICCFEGVKIIVDSFSVVIFRNSKIILLEKNIREAFSEEVRKGFLEVKPNDKILLFDIHYSGPARKSIRVNKAIEFTIVE